MVSSRFLCPLVSSGFGQWKVSVGGGRRIKEGGKEKYVYFSGSLSASSHLAVILFLFLVPHLLLGCSFLKASAFTRFCSSSYFRPKKNNNFPCCTILGGPLHPAYTLNYTRTLADTNDLIGLFYHNPGTLEKELHLMSHGFCIWKVLSFPRVEFGFLSKILFQFCHPNVYVIQQWSLGSFSCSSLPLTLWIIGGWSQNNSFLWEAVC